MHRSRHCGGSGNPLVASASLTAVIHAEAGIHWPLSKHRSAFAGMTRRFPIAATLCAGDRRRRVARTSASFARTANCYVASRPPTSTRNSRRSPRLRVGPLVRPSQRGLFYPLTRSICCASAADVDSQFPVDPHATRGAPRRVARKVTSSRSSPGRSRSRILASNRASGVQNRRLQPCRRSPSPGS
jgi:hypothetical protein